MKTFRVETAYESLGEDDNGYYGEGDYHYIEVIDTVTNKVVKRYGDEYHDKGTQKLDGFFDGIKYSEVSYSAYFQDVLVKY